MTISNVFRDRIRDWFVNIGQAVTRFFVALSGIVRDMFVAWVRDRVPQLSASLAFFALISLAPALMIAMRVAGLVIHRRYAETEVLHQIEVILGGDAVRVIQTVLERAAQPQGNPLTTIIDIVILVVFSTAVFNNIRLSLNIIWEVPPDSYRGIRNHLWNRVLALLIVIYIGALVVLVIGANALLVLISRWTDMLFPVMSVAPRVFFYSSFLLRFLLGTLMVAMIYRLLPDTHIYLRDVWIGAGVTSLLLGSGQWLILVFLQYNDTISAYGAAGSLVAILLWVYYSAMVFYLGAEFTHIYANRFGRGISKGA